MSQSVAHAAWHELYAYWLIRHNLALDGDNYIGDGGVTLYEGADQAIAQSRAVVSRSDAEQVAWVGERLETLGCTVR